MDTSRLVEVSLLEVLCSCPGRIPLSASGGPRRISLNKVQTHAFSIWEKIANRSSYLVNSRINTILLFVVLLMRLF